MIGKRVVGYVIYVRLSGGRAERRSLLNVIKVPLRRVWPL